MLLLLLCRLNSLVIPSESEFIYPKDEKERCVCCSINFTMFRRQHHCRLCACLCCDDCSKRRVILSGAQVWRNSSLFLINACYGSVRLESAIPAIMSPLQDGNLPRHRLKLELSRLKAVQIRVTKVRCLVGSESIPHPPPLLPGDWRRPRYT